MNTSGRKDEWEHFSNNPQVSSDYFILSVADFEQYLPAYHLRGTELKLVIFHFSFLYEHK